MTTTIDDLTSDVFHRGRLGYERAWTTLPTVAVRDRRIAGDPLAVFAFVLDVAIGQPISTGELARELGLTLAEARAAFDALEAAGYLPAGTAVQACPTLEEAVRL